MTATFNSTPEHMPLNSSSSLTDVAERAYRYSQEGNDAYSEHVIAENRSKTMYLALLAMGASNGMAGIQLGHPGSSKSLMIKVGHQIVEGIEDGNVATVPHRMDLQPAELVGNSSEVVRTIEADGDTKVEKMSQELKPILHPSAMVLHFDEITRTSPYALNAALQIIQDGKIALFGKNGETTLLSTQDIDLIAAASNNYGTAYVNKLDPAIVGRFGMGVFTGERPEDGPSEVKQTMWSNPSKRYGMVDGVTKVIDRPELHEIRKRIELVPIQDNVPEYGVRLTDELNRKMSLSVRDGGFGVNMADGRSDQQIIRVAQTLALLNKHKEVKPQHVLEATRYWATAKLGLTNGATEKQIDDFVYGLDSASH